MRAYVVTFALAIVGGSGFSVAPALQATRAAWRRIKDGAANPIERLPSSGMRNLLVVAQVAGSRCCGCHWFFW